jgi:hypothetical protein
MQEPPRHAPADTALTDEAVVCLWQERARLSSSAHYHLGNRYAKRNSLVSIVVVVLSTVAGSTAFAAFGSGRSWGLAVGAVSIAAAVTAAVQRALHLAEFAERHHEAGAGWDKLFNELTLRRAGDQEFSLRMLQREIDTLVDKSPYIPERLFAELGLPASYNDLLFRQPPAPPKRWRDRLRSLVVGREKS